MSYSGCRPLASFALHDVFCGVQVGLEYLVERAETALNSDSNGLSCAPTPVQTGTSLFGAHLKAVVSVWLLQRTARLKGTSLHLIIMQYGRTYCREESNSG